jgi:hypothetical protein
MTRGKTAVMLAAVGLLALSGHDAAAARGARARGPAARSTLSVSISGPSTVQIGYTCQWSAVVSGGTPPYTYLWMGPGNSYGFDQTFWATTNGGSDLLYLEVHDANGDDATIGKSIHSGGTGCGS